MQQREPLSDPLLNSLTSRTPHRGRDTSPHAVPWTCCVILICPSESWCPSMCRRSWLRTWRRNSRATMR